MDISHAVNSSVALCSRLSGPVAPVESFNAVGAVQQTRSTRTTRGSPQHRLRKPIQRPTKQKVSQLSEPIQHIHNTSQYIAILQGSADQQSQTNVESFGSLIAASCSAMLFPGDPPVMSLSAPSSPSAPSAKRLSRARPQPLRTCVVCSAESC